MLWSTLFVIDDQVSSGKSFWNDKYLKRVACDRPHLKIGVIMTSQYIRMTTREARTMCSRMIFFKQTQGLMLEAMIKEIAGLRNKDTYIS